MRVSTVFCGGAGRAETAVLTTKLDMQSMHRVDVHIYIIEYIDSLPVFLPHRLPATLGGGTEPML